MKQNFLTACVALIIFLVAGCENKNDSNWSVLKFRQTVPVICHHEATDSTDTHGDMHFFEANLLDTTGKVVGQSIGYQVMVDFAGKDGMGFEDMDERMTTMTYRFNEKDAIMVQGGIVFNPGDTHIVVEKENYRAIVGGTGIYKGARGQSIVTANKDGNVDIVLEYSVN